MATAAEAAEEEEDSLFLRFFHYICVYKDRTLMKKALKIAGITLASLVGIVIVAELIFVNTVASPQRLTRLLKQIAPQYINCNLELEKASMSLFKTFPNFGVDIEHVALINPMEGSPSDSLASIDQLTVAVDIKKLLKEKEIELKECSLENALVNIFIDPEGKSNLNVFKAQEKADSSAGNFDYLVNIEQIKLKNTRLKFTDRPSHFSIQFEGIDMDLNGAFQNNDIQAELKLKVGYFSLLNYATSFAMGNISLGFVGSIKQFDKIEGQLTGYKPDLQLVPSKIDPVSVTFPFEFSLKTLSGHYEKAVAKMNDFRFYVNGNAKVKNGNIIFGFDVKSNEMALKSLLAYLPEDKGKKLGLNKKKDKVKLTVDNAGVTINPTRVPILQLGFRADDVALTVVGQHTPHIKLGFDAQLTQDLRKVSKEGMKVNKMEVKLNNSSLDLKRILDRHGED